MKNRRSGKQQVVTGLFVRCVSAAMACFLSCFRAKDFPSPPSTSTSSSSASPETMFRKRNRLASFIISQHEECSELEEDNEIWEVVPNQQADVDIGKLEDEAKFLEACGTIPKIPPEIQNMEREGKCQLNGNGDPQGSKLKSLLDVIPTEQLNIEKKQSQPLTPAQKCEELTQGDASFSASIQNSGTITIRSDEGNNEEQNAMTFKVPANESYKSASIVQGRKSVRFYCDTGASSVQNLSPEIDSETSKDLGAASICNILRPDPYPTPLRLNDEMQTPGTVFSAYQDGMANGKKTRVRSQYVKSVLNPVENLYQWQGMKAEVSEFNKLSVEQEESHEEAEARHSLSGKELNMESNLASWLQAYVANQDENHYVSQEKVPCVQTLEDRPVLGLVASHRDDSPKSWDGDGTPNSTSKYKEDQKVRFHSTPFVERLEKSLSEDTIIPQRKPSSGRRSPTEMSGLEESDSALSKLQSSVNIKTIASC